MLESRAAVATIIVLVILAALLATSPNVSGFFASVASKVSLLDNRIERNIEFSATFDRYVPINATARKVNITLEGDTRIVLDSGNIVTNAATISDFDGKISVSDRILLDGTFSAIETRELLWNAKGGIKLESDFSRAEIHNLAVSNLDAYNISGTMSVKGTETSFHGSARISEPKADFVFDNNLLLISGRAKKILIPDSGINIS